MAMAMIFLMRFYNRKPYSLIGSVIKYIVRGDDKTLRWFFKNKTYLYVALLFISMVIDEAGFIHQLSVSKLTFEPVMFIASAVGITSIILIISELTPLIKWQE